MSAPATSLPRMGVALRHRETVTPLDLFFDLVFLLAITQCTALMANDPTWAGIGRGLLVLGVLWWSWVGYAVLASRDDARLRHSAIGLAASTAVGVGVLLAGALGGARTACGRRRWCSTWGARWSST